MRDAAYVRVNTVAQALQLARGSGGDYIYSAGGTDLQINRKQELIGKSLIVDLCEIPELRNIRVESDSLVIGSMATIDDLILSREVTSWCSLIVEAARSIATPVIRMTATVGGNLLVSNRCSYYNQSSFWRQSAGSCLRDTGDTCIAIGGGDKCFSRNVSDMAPALIALDAHVTIQDQESKREMPLIDLYATDGIRHHANLDKDAILASVRVSLQPVRWWYRKLRRRESLDFTSLTVAATVDDKHHARICLNGISMSPVMIEVNMGTAHLDDLKSLARRNAKVVDNDLMPLSFRREMMNVFMDELWADLGVA